MTPTRFVDSSDARIAVYEEGDPDGPTLVLVHGWPDSHVLWDGVVPLLRDTFRIIRYDNRAVGESSGPAHHSGYTMARYADDFAAVIAATSPAEPVHVLAHDWGSTAIWEYLSRPGADDRVAAFTSVSGPSGDHLNRYVMGGLKRPYRPRRFLRSLAQLSRLSYMGAFSVPVLAPAAVRLFVAEKMVTRSLRRRDGIPAEHIHHGPAYRDDAANSLKVYRANFFRSFASARNDHYVRTPVQLIVNTRDPFVRYYIFDETPRWVPRLWRRDIASGHWAPMSHPQVLAQAVAELAEFVRTGHAARALRRAEVGRRDRGPFTDTLVSVTGAGRGIGRETALAFAAEGAEVIVSDIDEAGAKDTAAAIASRGGVAHAYALDVSDAAAVERFAERICAEHGVPDVVVNNAGIGQAGQFLDTPREQWDRVLEVNLGGVVNCCRAFAAPMVARGAGGHVVNVASMAAYAPLQSLNAYCTSKAAVYMFSDCLRAELSAAGIGLTTICPGLIDTGIVGATRFDTPAGGAGARQGAQARAKVQKLFSVRRYPPQKVARQIVSAVRKDKAIQPVAPEAHLLYGVSRVLPPVLRSTARGRVV
ncbi:SDR family oxidoreductase [Mycolicibacterium palauense]|uniref:SDR family oxidoreductase n=1 Tax=Mycolicibacterium palauense TaxID=2034511 RepID=UPI000BFEBDD1|nr:SDR family oxidoreductase [Mycolicibacterium palauense]